MTTITLLAGQVSQVTFVPAGSRITSSGSGSIEWMPGTPTDAANSPNWSTWAKGSSAGYMDTLRAMSIRATATGSMTVTIEEGFNDKYGEDAYFDGDYPTLSTDANGNTAILDAAGAIAFRAIGSYTWATRPAAASNTGVIIRITDVGGSSGSRWISDGAYWKPEGGRVVLGASGAAVACAVNTNENTLATITVPAYAMGPNGILTIVTTWTSTNSANTKVPRVRFGGPGGDQALVVSAITTSATVRYWTEIQNRNNLAQQVGGTGGGQSNLATANAAIFTGAQNTALDKDIVITGQKGLDSENFTLERYLVELIVP